MSSRVSTWSVCVYKNISIHTAPRQTQDVIHVMSLVLMEPRFTFSWIYTCSTQDRDQTLYRSVLRLFTPGREACVAGASAGRTFNMEKIETMVKWSPTVGVAVVLQRWRHAGHMTPSSDITWSLCDVIEHTGHAPRQHRDVLDPDRQLQHEKIGINMFFFFIRGTI